jgi:integrase
MDRVAKFLGLYTSPNTRKCYRYSLQHFFTAMYGKGDIYTQGDQYFSEDRSHEDDLNVFLNYLNGKPPKTIRLRLSVVRTFLSENDKEFPQKFWRRLNKRVKGSQARTMDRVPRNTELRRIMVHLPIHGKALFLTLASSGMRIGEALQLQLDDVDLAVDPARLSIRGEYTKTGNPRVAFVTGEATEAIQEWLRNREQYIESAVKKSTLYKKSTKDRRLFPFRSDVAYRLWNGALFKAELNGRDKTTNVHELHVHVLRKFFRTRMGGVINRDVVEALMGHEGYLTGEYRRYDVSELAKHYTQGEHVLHVFSDGEQVGRLRQEVEAKNQQLQTLVNGLATENMTLKDEVKVLKVRGAATVRRLEAIEAVVARLRSNVDALE